MSMFLFHNLVLAPLTQQRLSSLCGLPVQSLVDLNSDPVCYVELIRELVTGSRPGLFCSRCGLQAGDLYHLEQKYRTLVTCIPRDLSARAASVVSLGYRQKVLWEPGVTGNS